MSERSRVLELVRRYPGVHEREIERQLGLSSRLAAYHLESLVADGEVARVEARGYVRYLPAESRLSAADVELLCMLRRTPVLQVLLFLLREGEATAGAISAALGLAKPSASYHLGALLDAEVLAVRPAGRERWYRVADPAFVRRALARFEPVPGELDAFASVWDDLTR